MGEIYRNQDEFFMNKALILAKKAFQKGEVPVGALICQPISINSQTNNKGKKKRADRGEFGEFREKKESDFSSWRILSESFNLMESSFSSLAHAEMLAIEEASQKLKAWRLKDCVLYTTLEPCIMCAGAIVSSRLSAVIYGAQDPKSGGMESLYRICQDRRLNHQPILRRGVLAESCAQILKDFFQKKRELSTMQNLKLVKRPLSDTHQAQKKTNHNESKEIKI